MQKFIAVCDSALDLMILEKKRLLNGHVKNELSEWYKLFKNFAYKLFKKKNTIFLISM